ncbi:MAG: hypothetical protein ACHQRJ_02560 [Alphaproteobacteria bacterium]
MRVAPSSLFAIFMSVVVAGAIAASLSLMESPAQARLKKNDAARVRELLILSKAIEKYQRIHKQLPRESLDILREPDPFTSNVRLKDASGQPYEYAIKDATTYELCAHFDTVADEGTSSYDPNGWKHGSGRYCFNLHVEPHTP